MRYVFSIRSSPLIVLVPAVIDRQPNHSVLTHSAVSTPATAAVTPPKITSEISTRMPVSPAVRKTPETIVAIVPTRTRKVLLSLAKQQPVMHRRRDQQRRGRSNAHERHEIVVAIERGQLAEAGVERHHQQEREQHLNPGARDRKLVQQLDRVAVELFDFGFVALRGPVSGLLFGGGGCAQELAPTCCS